MKTLIFILITISFSLNIFSQAKQIQELDAWPTYGDSIVFPVKVSGETSANKMYFIDAFPKILKETNGGTSLVDRNDANIRFSNNSGTEYYVLAKYLIPYINQFTTHTLSSTDYIPFYELGAGEDSKITYANFLTNVAGQSTITSMVDGRFGNSTFNTEVDQEITAYVDESFLLNLLQTQGTTECYIGGDLKATIYYNIIGDNLTAVVFVHDTGSGTATQSGGGALFFPSAGRPIITSSAHYIRNSDNQHNMITMYTTGAITLDLDIGYGSGLYHIQMAYRTN